MDIINIRSDFPLLEQPIKGRRLVYLDSAATTQKPACVLETIQQYYREFNANVHRGVYSLSAQATKAYEAARLQVQTFLNAKEARECIFVRGTTEAINLVAHSFGETFIQANDEILISEMEHHSNIVPWQLLCQRKKAQLKFIPLTLQGELDLSKLQDLLSSKTKLVALTQVSNVLGTINPIAQIIQQAHAKGIPVLIDGAQAVPHLKVDVQALDCDFYVFSSHKVYGPTGVGVLYGKAAWLEKLSPYQGGGEMIEKVSLNTGTTYQDIPLKFEAGTPPIAEAIALGKALQYLSALGFTAIARHEQQLLEATLSLLSEDPSIRLIGKARERIGVVSFVMEGIHPHDIGTIMDQCAVALRTGHHCAMPIMEYFDIPGTSRLSFGIYNTLEDIEQFGLALQEVKRIFKREAHGTK